MTQTPLDAAHARMQAAPADEAARLGFYDRLAASELFLLLDAEPEAGGPVKPAVFPVEGRSYVLIFDREERLARFTGAPAPYAALSGRALARMLAGQGDGTGGMEEPRGPGQIGVLGLGLNLSVASSSILIPAEGVAWLADMVAGQAEEVEERPVAIASPLGLPEALLSTLDARLASAAGLARCALLATVRYAPSGLSAAGVGPSGNGAAGGARVAGGEGAAGLSGAVRAPDGGGMASGVPGGEDVPGGVGDRAGHLLAFIDAVPGSEAALTQIAREAYAFSGAAAGVLDVAFFASHEPMVERLARVGLRFDLPATPEPAARASPGSDPDRPPILR